MDGYELYYVDAVGHVEGSQQLCCSTDEEAIKALHAERYYAELWRQGQFLRSNDMLISDKRPVLASSPNVGV
jgi:hypothetical protein